jgi:hypothetical protein
MGMGCRAAVSGDRDAGEGRRGSLRWRPALPRPISRSASDSGSFVWDRANPRVKMDFIILQLLKF